MKFENIRAAMNAHYDQKITAAAADLDALTCKEALASWYYKQQMTPAALALIQAADPDELLPEAARSKMYARIRRDHEKSRAAALQKIESVEAAKEVMAGSVIVEWRKSNMWGWNPTATLNINYERANTTGKAGGCGYDKLSAAMAEAFNKSPEVMRILYKHAEEGRAFPYSVHVHAGIPSFDGGCGASCFEKVFSECGYKFSWLEQGGKVDLFSIRKN